jgi:AbrB family looped-hinge helix DNA binding protein
MQTSVSKRGRTVVPAPIRKRHGIKAGDQLVWIDDGVSIRVVPAASDPLHALRGIAKGENLFVRLLEDSHAERGRD